MPCSCFTLQMKVRELVLLTIFIAVARIREKFVTKCFINLVFEREKEKKNNLTLMTHCSIYFKKCRIRIPILHLL